MYERNYNPVTIREEVMGLRSYLQFIEPENLREFMEAMLIRIEDLESEIRMLNPGLAPVDEPEAIQAGTKDE